MSKQQSFWLMIALLFCTGASYTHGFTVDVETRLRDSLLTNYSSAVRPDMTTVIELGINVLSINYVDMKNEKFSLSGWWAVKWTDSRLSWTGTSYTVPVIQVYETNIWTPALVVDNSINDLSAIDEESIPLRVRKDGQVNWNPPGILSTSCEMDITYFPFDTQTCGVQVTSFGYTIQELDINVHSTGVSTKYFTENGEWTLISVWNERSEFDEDGYTYAKVTFYFQMQRRAVYYGLNTMLPVLLNSLLIPLVFLLPHDSGEKIGYCLTVLLAYVVILTIVTDGLPTTAKNQSLLGVYIAMVLTMSGMTVALSIHSLNLYHRPLSRRIPGWQVRLTRLVLAIKGCTCKRERVQDAPRDSHHFLTSSVTPLQCISSEEKKRPMSFHRNPIRVTSTSGVDTDVMRSVTPTKEDEDLTWQDVAHAYDAFFLRCYFCIIFFSSIGFLLAIVSGRI